MDKKKKKLMDGWMDGQKKMKKSMDGRMDRKNGWLDG